MDDVDYTDELGRAEERAMMTAFLRGFEANKTDPATPRCVYVSGPTGAGKTRFVYGTLRAAGYDIVGYDTCDSRNKGVVEGLASTTIGSMNVMGMLGGKVQPIAIVMDDVDGMNTGDKGGINHLIKLVRPKKTARQRGEPQTMSPVICIGGQHADKKLTELRGAAGLAIDLHHATSEQVERIVARAAPELTAADRAAASEHAHGDLHRVAALLKLLRATGPAVWRSIVPLLLSAEAGEATAKDITASLFQRPAAYKDHGTLIGETDRTSVGLLVHENAIDVLGPEDVGLYMACLEGCCRADRIDRAAFQKQIWGFSEMSSLIKTLGTANTLARAGKLPADLPGGARFTKVLTKYSTEYNNAVFVRSLCAKTGLDKKDVLAYFVSMRQDGGPKAEAMDSVDISKLEMDRIERLLAT